jgi:hypothetical protein
VVWCSIQSASHSTAPITANKTSSNGRSTFRIMAVRPFDDHFPNILSTSSRDGLQCGPAVFPFSWFHHQSRLQANFAAQGAGTGSDRNKASRLTRSLLSLIMTSPGIR